MVSAHNLRISATGLRKVRYWPTVCHYLLIHPLCLSYLFAITIDVACANLLSLVCLTTDLIYDQQSSFTPSQIRSTRTMYTGLAHKYVSRNGECFVSRPDTRLARLRSVDVYERH